MAIYAVLIKQSEDDRYAHYVLEDADIAVVLDKDGQCLTEWPDNARARAVAAKLLRTYRTTGAAPKGVTYAA